MSSAFMNRYKTDREMEENGVWVDFGDGIQVKIRRANSKHSRDTRAKLEKPYAGQFRNREMPQSLQDEILIKQLAQSIVVDWKGVPDPSNPDSPNPFPCNEENVIKVMTQFPDFREDILTASVAQATFQRNLMADAEKNSRNVFVGTSDQSQTSIP